MLYITETHCHTSEVSRCANENAKDTADKYAAAGYTTVVLTNHLSDSTEAFRCGNNDKGIEDFIAGYHEFRTAANGRFHTLLGAEIRLTGRGMNDYLLFGVTEDFLRSNTDILNYSPKDLHNVCSEHGILIIQAHPFRIGMKISRIQDIDGIEVFNGHPNHQSHNDIADRWANYYHLIKTAGSDHHNTSDQPVCGIQTESPITTNDELVAVLKTNSYRLLRFESPEKSKPHTECR